MRVLMDVQGNVQPDRVILGWEVSQRCDHHMNRLEIPTTAFLLMTGF